MTTRTGKQFFWPRITLFWAAGATPDRALPEALKGKYLDFAEIGDCVKPRKIREAVEEGIWAAVAL